MVGVLEGTPRIRAVVALYPVTDFIALGQKFNGSKNNLLDRLFGGTYAQTKPVAFAASPINHVGPTSPPFLLLHGDKDATVPLDQSQHLQQKLHESGVTAILIIAPGQGHGFAPTPADRVAILQFLNKELKASTN